MSFTFTDVLILASEAHRGVKDKGNVDYIKHPLELAHNLKKKGYSNEHQITALLHDVIEDTEWTFEQLEELHVPESIMEALRLLTHEVDRKWISEKTDEYVTKNPEIPHRHHEKVAKEAEYLNYVRRLSTNDIARAVKLEDLRHNMDMTRIPTMPTKKDGDRMLKYMKARNILSNTVGY